VQQILVSSLILTALVMALVLLVLLARRLLGAYGTVSVRVGEDRVLEVEAGRRLLWALADAGLHLPAACGGKGACGQCRVLIREGRPELSQMGAQHIGPEDAAAGYRLACMVRTWEDMRVSIAAGSLARGRWDCRVVSNRSISVYLKELVLALPEGERIDFEAGDYVQVEVPPYRLEFTDLAIDPPFDAEWKRLGLLRLVSEVPEVTIRAYSLANPPQQDREMHLVIRIATPPATAPLGTPPGRASSYLFGLRAGDRLTLSGPFGTFHATDDDTEMILIAGGAGIAPIRSIVLDQLARGATRRMSLWFGARDRYDLCYYEELEALAAAHDNFDVTAVLSEPRADDGWTGATGFVHAAVYAQYLERHPAPAKVEYYLCGPPVMAAAVIDMLAGLGVPRASIYLDDFGA